MKILRVLVDSNGEPKSVDLRFDIGEVYDIGLLMADNEEIKKLRQQDNEDLNRELGNIDERLNSLESNFYHHKDNDPHISIYHDHYTP